MERICGRTFEELVELAKQFHGYPAPGLIAGGFMVDLARDSLPEGILFDAIAETRSCLPDAIQLLTPCTIGNGWLKIVDLGRFAMCLYDKRGGDGVRVCVDPARLGKWPEMETWLMKLRPKREQDSERLFAQIREAGRRPYRVQPVKLPASYCEKRSKGPIGICPLCNEAYPQLAGMVCRSCQGESPYLAIDAVEGGEDSRLGPLAANG